MLKYIIINKIYALVLKDAIKLRKVWTNVTVLAKQVLMQIIIYLLKCKIFH